MTSAIDSTKPAAGVPASKADLRNNLAIAKAEITALQSAALYGSEFGITADGVTNDSAALSSAIVAALASGRTLHLPAGQILLNTPVFANLAAEETLNIEGNRETTLLLNTGPGGSITFRTTEKTTVALASPIPQFQNYLDLADASILVRGDCLYIASDTAAETSWGYKKQCIRRAAVVDGNRVYLDEPLEWFFGASETVTLTVFPRAEVNIRGVNVRIPTLKSVANGFNGISNLMSFHSISGSFTDGTIEGPIEGWQDGYSDGVAVVRCDDFTFDNFNFYKLRYGPQMSKACRNVTIKNCWMRDTRHPDVSEWGQGILLENITSFSSDNIIQNHGAIRMTFRNIHDRVTQLGLSGLGLRGVGETVMDCTSHSVTELGFDTQRILFNADHLEWCQGYTRHIERFFSTTVGLSCGGNGRFVVRECRVPRINVDGDSHILSSVEVDDATVITMPYEVLPSGIHQVNHQQIGGVKNVRLVDSFARDGAATAITGITLADPVQIDSVGHSIADGDFLRVMNVSGADELDRQYFKAANVVAGVSFTLTDADDNPIDGTAMTAYVSGGTVSKHVPAKMFDRLQHPNVGSYPAAHFVMSGVQEGQTLGQATKLMVRTETGSSLNQEERWGEMIVRAYSGQSVSVQHYSFVYDINPGSSRLDLIAGKSYEFGSVTVSASNFYLHGATEASAEGQAISGQAHDAYYSFDVNLPATADEVQVEIREIRKSSFLTQSFTPDIYQQLESPEFTALPS